VDTGEREKKVKALGKKKQSSQAKFFFPSLLTYTNARKMMMMNLL
jgi:hypothetical protein